MNVEQYRPAHILQILGQHEFESLRKCKYFGACLCCL